MRRGPCQQRNEIVGGHGPVEVVALDQVDAQLAAQLVLIVGLDTFGYGFQTEIAGQADDV